MSNPVESLKPASLWKYFDRIRKIPHGSGNEKALGEAVMGWARERGAQAERDAVGNVIVRIPASKGLEKAPGVVLQGHLDMVCEKNAETAFDFEKDAISLVRDGDWLKADGTTLGADNAMGLAAALALLDDKDAVHGPVEILCTVEEETGLVGARSLTPDFVKGRMLFNVDSEEDGIFYVGCAGGRDTEIALHINTIPVGRDTKWYNVSLKGLRGGHSGLDIVHNRGNALRLLGRAVSALSSKIHVQVSVFRGGDKHNAIPREALALIGIPAPAERELEAVFTAQLAGFRSEFASGEPELSLSWTNAEAPQGAWDADSAKHFFWLLLGLPHGVLSMSRDMQGMVETSNNVARVRIEGNTAKILCSSRSSVASALDGVVAQIHAIGNACGAVLDTNEGYPGWQPNMDSKLLARARDVWRKVHGTDAKFQAIHAGLECGIIGEKYAGMDMISLGPTIQNPHSPDERVLIPTVERFYGFLVAFLADLAS